MQTGVTAEGYQQVIATKRCNPAPLWLCDPPLLCTFDPWIIYFTFQLSRKFPFFSFLDWYIEPDSGEPCKGEHVGLDGKGEPDPLCLRGKGMRSL